MPSFSVARLSAFCRTSARALAACAAVAGAAPVAHAQASTLTFNGLTAVDNSGVRYVSNCYEEAGYRVTLVGMACGTDAALATWTPDNDLYYTGSPAMYNNAGPSVDFARVNGGAFSFQSIGLASFLGQLGDPTSVMFTGFLTGGGMVTHMLDVPGGIYGTPASLSMYNFTDFTNLTALRLTVTSPSGEPMVQFDNVRFGAAVVPEPMTVLLVGGGLAGLGMLARRRAR